MDARIIKEEVLGSVLDSNRKKVKLIELYFRDKKCFFSLIKKGELSEDTACFFEKCQQRLDDIHESVSIDFFREQKYMELIEEFSANPDSFKNKKKAKVNRTGPNVIQTKEQKYKQRKIIVHIMPNGNTYPCPYCGKRYPEYGEYSGLPRFCCVNCIKKHIDEEFASKKTKKKNGKGNILATGSSFINDLIRKTKNGKITWTARTAKEDNLDYVRYIYMDEKKGKTISLIKTTTESGTYYTLKEGQGLKQVVLTAVGAELLEKEIKKTNPLTTKTKIHIKTEEEKRLENEKLRQKEAEAKRLKAERKRENAERLKQQRIEKQRIEAEKREKQRQIQEEAERKREEAERERRRKEQEALAQLPQIGVRDFVVRRAVFKCMHNNHKIENLVAAVNIIDNKNEERLVKVSAGYCRTCNTYFVMESSYDNLKRMGIPLCRMSDEKTYLKNYSVNGMILAQESILMQYGYNVSQTEGLSSSRRQKILAVLIDKGILSKSEIISYLDFFISQRESQSKYQIAISKWEMDREFVEGYRIGEYHQYGVNALYRR